MATATRPDALRFSEPPASAAPSAPPAPAYQAFRLLQVGFAAVPIIAGLDKFTNLLVNWSEYLAPFIGEIVAPAVFMPIVGVVEIVAGIGVAIRPRIFAYVVALWLLGIAANVILAGYYDIALRDLGLALGALTLGLLSQAFDGRAARRPS